ncbi:MAG: methyltransferase, TIGR04325 family [Sedimentisphaerales bacterium]|nr:methyltransferase, TIGR04325 family [Sedimentisphaerales bacterium]
MDQKLKTYIKEFIPPAFLRWRCELLQRWNNEGRPPNVQYGYFGDYSGWQEALQDCEGYNADHILKKVRTALLKVKAGQAAYERDSVLFHDTDYSWPLLAGLLRIAAGNNNRLGVLDIGGSLGSTYYQNRSFLSSLDELHWCIVEQDHFVDCGRKEFETEQLRFYYDVESCLARERIDVVILSSVLPYLEKPFQLIDEIINIGIRHAIIDRTAFLPGADKDRLTVQRVSPGVYEASYPAWFFSKHKFLAYWQAACHCVAEFSSPGRTNIADSQFMGMIFERYE